MAYEGVEVERGGNDTGLMRRGPPRVGTHPMSEILKKYPDCRTDLIGGAATQTFAATVLCVCVVGRRSVN